MSGIGGAGGGGGGADTPVVVRGLEKRFGRSRALTGLDLTAVRGEVHGFLGPNGAGKSTTLRILLGLLKPSGGTARVFGLDPWHAPAASRRDIAYVPGDVDLWPNLTGGEIIDLLAGARGGADPTARARLLDAFELDPRRRARTYSKGNRQKVALVAAFSRPARLYVLDEPTSGLDPLMEQVFGAEVQRVAGHGATVLLSSHILSEVEHLCDRVTIVRGGRTVETGTLADLRHLSRTAFDVTGIRVEAVAGIEGVHDARADAGRIRFDVDDTAIPAVLATLGGAGVAAIRAEPPTLEALFLRHYVDVSAVTDAAEERG